MKRTSILNLAIAIGCFVLLNRNDNFQQAVTATISIIVFFLLELRSLLTLFAQNAPNLPFAYKAEITINPEFRKLMEHEFVKDYYERALPIADSKENSKIGDNSLWSTFSLRYLIINNMFWCDLYKTFIKNVRFAHRILDYDLSEKEPEPNLDIEIKNGFLRFWFSLGAFSKHEPLLICEFPLFIFEDIPIKLIDMKYGSPGWSDYVALRRLSVPPLSPMRIGVQKKIEQQQILRQKILSKYNFAPYSDGEPDPYNDRDGEHQLFEFDSGYQNEYFKIQVEEILDDV